MDNGRGNAAARGGKAKHRADNPGVDTTTICAVSRDGKEHLHTVAGPTARLGKQILLTRSYMAGECEVVVGSCQRDRTHGPDWYANLNGFQREWLDRECGA